tara:strand:- start:47 stop:493 length:447 start_codon:yes stop_codon:yes gene_type:complete
VKQLLTEWRKFLKEAQEISIDIEGATIDGVVHNDIVPLMNWANSQGVSEKFIQNLIKPEEPKEPKLVLPVAIMKNAFVPEEDRGQGVGSQLVDDFMSEADYEGAKSIILIADLGQSQAEGFSLIDWYKEYRFEVVGETGGNPVMVLLR